MFSAKDKVTFRGVPFEYGDSFIVVPPLTTGSFRENYEKIQSLVTAPDQPTSENVQDAITVKLEIIHVALMRNYADLKLEDVAEIFDMANINAAFSAAIGADRMSKKVKSAGEIPPVLSVQVSGTESTPA